MSNAVTFQTLVDGPRNVVIKIDGVLDTSDLSATDVVDPAALSPIDNYDGRLANQLRIDDIMFSIDEGLSVSLLWDASADVRIVDLVKAGKMNFVQFGGLVNNAGTGKTGKIQITTEGWSSGKIYEFTVILTLVKQLV